MTEASCEEALRRLALGETGPEHDAHLASCSSCAGEARRVGVLLRSLSEEASVRPGEALDRRLMKLFLDTADLRRGRLRPFVATGLAAGGMLALTAGVAAALAQAGQAEQGVALALLIVTAYGALSSAATLPILLLGRMRAARLRMEVRS